MSEPLVISAGEADDLYFDRLLTETLAECTGLEPGQSYQCRLLDGIFNGALDAAEPTVEGEDLDAAATRSKAMPLRSFASLSALGGGRSHTGRGRSPALLPSVTVLLLLFWPGTWRLVKATPGRPGKLVVASAPAKPQFGSQPGLQRAPLLARTMGAGPGQRGTPSRFAADQLNPRKAPTPAEASIDMPTTLAGQPPADMTSSAVQRSGVAGSPPPGTPTEIGQEIGNGTDRALEPGADADAGSRAAHETGGRFAGGVETIGGEVSAPVVLFQPAAESSEEARKARVSGNVLIYLQVDEQGRPEHVRVLRGMGLGLDRQAVAAVERYRFRPSMKHGRPVRVEMTVEVGFPLL